MNLTPEQFTRLRRIIEEGNDHDIVRRLQLQNSPMPQPPKKPKKKKPTKTPTKSVGMEAKFFGFLIAMSILAIGYLTEQWNKAGQKTNNNFITSKNKK